MPAVAIDVLMLADDPSADAGRLRQCIERDPALAAKLLRVVNSSLFGLGRPVTDLTQAVAMLGVKSLKLLVLGFSLPDRLFAAKGTEPLRLYWTRTLTRAVAARELAEVVGNRRGDEVFLAGLLADLGTLVLVQEAGTTYLDLYSAAGGDGERLRADETKAFGFDHVALTLRLLTEWKLPESFVDTIERLAMNEVAAAPTAGPPHDEPLTASVRILRLASRLASLVIDERADLWPAVLQDASAHFGLTAEQLAGAAEAVQEKVDELAKLMRLEISTGAAYRETLEQAHRLMRTVAEDAIADLLDRRERAATTVAEQGLLAEVERLRDAAQQARTEMSNSIVRKLPLDGESESPPPAARPEPPARRDAAGAAVLRWVPTPASAEAGDLASRLAAVIIECREARSAVSLAVIELDYFEESKQRFGPVWAHDQTLQLAAACAAIDWPHAHLLRLAESKLALILPQAGRERSLEIADEVLRHFRRQCPRDESGATGLSIGLATIQFPPRNFPPHDLTAAAERCLYAAHHAAGDAVKSIEIF